MEYMQLSSQVRQIRFVSSRRDEREETEEAGWEKHSCFLASQVVRVLLVVVVVVVVVEEICCCCRRGRLLLLRSR